MPFIAKMSLLKSVVIPTLTFGGEIFGMNKVLCRSLDSVLASCCRHFCQGWGLSVASVPLEMELGISSVFSTVSRMKARALFKFPSLSTVIAHLCNGTVRARKQTWLSGGQRWLIKANGSSGEVLSSKKVQDWCDYQCRAGDKTRGMTWYVNGGFGGTRGYLRRYAKLNLLLDVGLCGLIAARCGGLLTGERAASLGMIKSRFRSQCCSCFGKTPETLEHLLVDCPRWEEERKLFLSAMIWEFPLHNAKAMATLLLGGCVSEEQVDDWLTGSSDAEPGFLRVIRFFGAIYSRHNALLWAQR